MVDGTRKIAALYEKSGASRRGRGKGGGKGKGARPPSPVAPSSSSEEVPSVHAWVVVSIFIRGKISVHKEDILMNPLPCDAILTYRYVKP